MIRKALVVYLILICSIILADENGNLGNCFGNGKTSCDKNRASIGGEYYECRVLKRFDKMPKRVVFNKGIFLRLENGIFKYDENTSELTSSRFKMPRMLKTVDHLDKQFTGGAGKASIKFSDDEDDMDIVTTGDTSFDQIELHKKLNKLFILSHEIKKSKKDESGSLYYLDAGYLVLADNVILAEKIEDVEQKFSSMAIHPNKDMLLLTGQDDLGGKLMGISLTKGDPCEKFKRITLTKLDNENKLTGEYKEDFIQIVKEAEDKLTKLLEKFVASSPGTVNSTPKVKNLENQIDRLKKDLETAMKKMNMWRSKLIPLSSSFYQSAHQRVETVYRPNSIHVQSEMYIPDPQSSHIMQMKPIPIPPPPPMYIPQPPMYIPQPPMYIPQPPMYTPQQSSSIDSKETKDSSHVSNIPKLILPPPPPPIIVPRPLTSQQSSEDNNQHCFSKWEVENLKINLDICERSKMDMADKLRSLLFDDDTQFDSSKTMPESNNFDENPPIYKMNPPIYPIYKINPPIYDVRMSSNIKTDIDNETESTTVNTTENSFAVDYIDTNTD